MLEVITIIASIATTIGVFVAARQIKLAKDLQRIQFEDSLSREYRELMQNIPVNALLGKQLTNEEFADARKYLYHYFSLTNDQIFLRSKGRVCNDTWRDWQTGIEINLQLPAFQRMWREIERDSKNFLELRNVLREGLKTDPNDWLEEPSVSLLPGQINNEPL